MNRETLYSIRMRAAHHGQHVSGAERVVSADKIDQSVHSLTVRAKRKIPHPHQIVITIESLQELPVRAVTALDVVTVNASDMTAGRSSASTLLQGLGIAQAAVHQAMVCLARGPAPSGGNMRGAMIIDAETGRRLEPDQERGLRATRFDWSDEAYGEVDGMLTGAGLTHFRIREALALATKVAHAPHVLAELCWSDDSDYFAGYVASLRTGYVRFPVLKPEHDSHGGRAIFVDRIGLDMSALRRYLQQDVVLISSVGAIRRSLEPENILESINTD